MLVVLAKRGTCQMSLSKNEAVEKARKDLTTRLNVSDSDIDNQMVEDAEFGDMALGAATDGEMSGQMMTKGWRIRLQARGQTLEYRADKNQVRLFNYKGRNFLV
jgi:hypothetical protein